MASAAARTGFIQIVQDALGLGWSLIPCGKNKRPLIPSWKEYQFRAATRDDIAEWSQETHSGELGGRHREDFATYRSRL
jgi:hypothetical protein